MHAKTLASTQELLFDQLRSQPDGLVCVADHQTKGKGRGSNEVLLYILEDLILYLLWE